MPAQRKQRGRGRRSEWLRPRIVAERAYGVRLRQVARQVAAIVAGFAPDGVIADAALDAVVKSLRGYAELIGPWAESAARYMLTDVSRRNEATWRTAGEDMAAPLRQEIRTAPTGQLFQPEPYFKLNHADFDCM